MRCIEIALAMCYGKPLKQININMRCIEIKRTGGWNKGTFKININMRCIEMTNLDQYALNNGFD